MASWNDSSSPPGAVLHIACCLRLRQMSPAGLEPARSKAWDLEAHSLDQLGHSDDTMHSFARCRGGRAHHPVASPGNRTPGARLETSYVTTTPVRLFVMCCLRSGSLLFACCLRPGNNPRRDSNSQSPDPKSGALANYATGAGGPPRNRTPDLLLPKQPSYH